MFVLFCWIILVSSSSQINHNFTNKAHAQTCTTNLPISGVTASASSSSYPPANVLDNNLNTRWSNTGIGSWIRADLGSTKNICSVDIAWAFGNIEQYHFVIATSTDGTTFTNKFSGDSSGTTLNSEKYPIPSTDARYIRVTVNGNTNPNFATAASIAELDVFGSSASSNSPPVANNQAVTTDKNTAKSITLTATDSNNDPLAYTIVTPPSHGTITAGTGAGRTYTPSSNYVGPDSFTFKANDGTVDSNTATVSITVQDTNSAPVANNQAVTTNKNTAKSITLTATDSNNDPLTYSIVTQPSHGTITGGTGAGRTYTPNTGYVGPDSFTFKANDGTADSNTATVSITVQDTGSGSCGTNLPISGVTASGNDGNLPSNVLDNNLATRWSSNGIGESITADLGLVQNICSVDIAWYNGNAREYHFVIATSTDGTTFTNKFSGDSTGTTLNSEKYNIPATDARYLRVTVNGNTVNNWASMTELDVFGSLPPGNSPPVAINQAVTTNKNTAKAITLTASDPNNDPLTYSIVTQPSHGTITGGTGAGRTYTPNTGYVGPDSFTFKANDGTVDSNTATVSITVVDAGKDQFGIIKLYPTKSGGEEWYMNMNNPLSDSRFNPQNTITKNPDGSWKMKATQVRMGVYTSTGYDGNDIPTLDHSVIASKGYMLAPNDWRNFEMTQYVKVNTSPSDDNFSPNGRGGRHTGSGAPEGCEGSSMKGDVFFSGKVRFAKEQWHVSYVFTNLKTPTSSIEDKWVGIKFVVYNFVENNKVVVKTELWLDTNNNGNFVKVDENVDRGGWGTEGTECGGAPDQIISWGGPITTFRWDTATDVDFKNLSVREIVSPQ